VAPLFVVGLGWRLLGEIPTKLQVGFIVLGVLGTTCLGLPGARACPPDCWIVGIAGALFAALAYYSLRKISAVFPTSVTVFAFMLVLALVAASLPDRSWQAPDVEQWTYLILVGIFGLFGQLWLTASFARLPAFLASVFNLSTLPMVCMLELVLDHHWPSLMECLAYGLILSSVALSSIFQPIPASSLSEEEGSVLQKGADRLGK
jgi:drug/metabolite transporter (DMT)-like permease